LFLNPLLKKLEHELNNNNKKSIKVNKFNPIIYLRSWWRICGRLLGAESDNAFLVARYSKNVKAAIKTNKMIESFEVYKKI